MSIFVLIVVVTLTFDRVECDDMPRNVVVMAGSDKVLHCTGGLPFRWYVYPPSKPTDDKVIFMGEQMADDVDQQFRIYKAPNNFPYDWLDLLITDVRSDHFGTYKCQKSMSAHCAELIVLGSEPKCRIHSATGDTAHLRCKVNITVNGKPEMNCAHNLNKALIHADCSERHNKSTICAVSVPASEMDAYTCVIGVKHKPIRTYLSCEHATNNPDYQYIWHASSSIDSRYSSECGIKKLSLLIAATSCIVIIVLAISVGVLCSKRRQRKRVADNENLSKENEILYGEHSPRMPDTPPPEYKYCSNIFSDVGTISCKVFS